MSIVVYWTQASSSEMFPDMEQPCRQTFTHLELVEALDFCQKKRAEPGVSHVCLSSENVNSVGKPGVNSIIDSKTPDGQDYDWKKRRV